MMKTMGLAVVVLATALVFAACDMLNGENDNGLTPLTGTVSIDGNPVVGGTLTANIDDLGGSGTISFQWRRGNTSVGIGNNTYIIQPDDLDSTITVTVTRADNYGSLTSTPVGPVIVAPGGPNDPIIAQGDTFEEQLDWLLDNVEDDTWYVIEINVDVGLAPRILYFEGMTVGIVLRGDETTISLSENGNLFTVGYGVTLILEDITLKGRNENDEALVLVNLGGTLKMEEGSKITGNNGTWGGGVLVVGHLDVNGGVITGNTAREGGGGVNIDEGGTITMRSGAITNNTARAGGGVFVWLGDFTMSDGTISDNTSDEVGGGVFVAGTFTMSDGTISGNTAVSQGGGGVFVSGGLVGANTTFIMSGGEISGNTSVASSGGGVFVMDGTGTATFTMRGSVRVSDNTAADAGGVFNMHGGKIFDNLAANVGGGVFLDGTFNMYVGTISGNTASSGGGVFVDVFGDNGEFIMRDGTISGNTASQVGGGVAIHSGVFTMEGGTISGNTVEWDDS